MYSPELQSKLTLLRQKVADNSITTEELKEAAALLRQERRGAVQNAAKRRATARASVKSADDLIAELEQS